MRRRPPSRSFSLLPFVPLLLLGAGLEAACSIESDRATPGDSVLSTEGPNAEKGVPQGPGSDSGAGRADGAAPPRDDASAPGEPSPLDDAGAIDPDSGALEEPPPPPPPPPGTLATDFVDYDVNHILVTGQSNSVATGGGAVLSPTQPFGNLRFDTGVMPMKGCDGDGCRTYDPPSSFQPLVQNDGFYGGLAETSTSGLANEISFLAQNVFKFGTREGYPTKHDVLTSIHGRSGNTYYCLRKGFCPYNEARGHFSPFSQGMMEVNSAKTIAANTGRSYAVRAVVVIHGESDHYSYERPQGHTEFPMNGSDGVPGKIKDYKDALLEWQRDYDASVKAITGQAHDIPLFLSAVSGWTTTRTSRLVQWQLDAHIAAPGKVIYVTPAYPMNVMNDCNHFSPAGERQLGEYFAKAYAKVVLSHQTWEPVRPKTITRGAGAESNVITVKYHVPAPPLAFDTNLVVAADNMGFDVLDDGVMVPIASVILTGPDTVKITLQSAPSGVNMRLRYAQNQNVDAGRRCIGNGLVYGPGARGNLRDSDDTPSHYGYALYNWGANFDFAIP